MAFFDGGVGKLDFEITAGLMALEMHERSRYPLDELVNRIGNEILERARMVSTKGKRAEAVAKVESRKIAGDETLTQVWNSILDQVLVQL